SSSVRWVGRMKRLLLALSLLVALGVPVVATAGVPQAVNVTITKGLGDFTPGTFIASGGISDSGGYQLVEEHDTAVPSPVVGTAHYVFTLTGAQGAITARAETLFRVVSFDPFVIQEDGSWLIVEGTGAYAGLHGQGELHK